MTATYSIPRLPDTPWRDRDRRVPPELHVVLASGVGDIVDVTVDQVMCLINCGVCTYDPQTRTVDTDPWIWSEGDLGRDPLSMAHWQERAVMIRALARRHRITLTPDMPAVQGNPLLSEGV